MVNFSATSSKSLILRRAPAFLALLALLLLQFSAAAHQIEHADDHTINVCDTCSALNQYDDALVPDTHLISVDASAWLVSIDVSESVVSAPVPTHRSRAPPII